VSAYLHVVNLCRSCTAEMPTRRTSSFCERCEERIEEGIPVDARATDDPIEDEFLARLEKLR